MNNEHVDVCVLNFDPVSGFESYHFKQRHSSDKRSLFCAGFDVLMFNNISKVKSTVMEVHIRRTTLQVYTLYGYYKYSDN